MLSSPAEKLKAIKSKYILINPRPMHFEQIQELCRKVYPFSKPWNIAQLESHHSYFPDGQLIVIEKESGKIVGLAFSLIVSWSDYSKQDNWQDFTSGGFFHNHNPRIGKTLYGAEIMVNPDCRGQGIGKLLYEGRRAILEKYGLKRIRAGARLRGYSKFKDKLSPQEYTKQVMDKKIFDPTLSFQLGQGFKVIDVVSNYLFNDPESLGYAAVIEWLNPKENTAKDYEKQNRGVDLFISGERFTPQFLPKELRQLVRKATTALGQAIFSLEGEELFKKVEHYREELKQARSKSKKQDQLDLIMKKLKKEKAQNLFHLAHAFSLQLEIVNLCESAYRTWRQQQKSWPRVIKNKQELTYVLTAHPTEARTKQTIHILNRILNLLIEGVQNNLSFDDENLMTQMRMLWLQPLSKSKSPTVLDEAEYINSLIFDSEIIDFILHKNPGYEIKLRTWVGGDKDGHPGVDSTVMKQCLDKSRKHIVEIISKKFSVVIDDLTSLLPTGKIKRSEIEALKNKSENLQKLKTISNGDGTKIKTWTTKYKTLIKNASPFLKDHAEILLLNRLFKNFPAFVLPIELREDAKLISNAIKDKDETIRVMLADLAKISGALKVNSYVRGLVISHCENESNLTEACRLIDITCKDFSLPVIPLLESNEALRSGKQILKNWLNVKRNHDRVSRHWGNKFEIMLGYSDSSKQIGVLPSRLLIAESMHAIEKALKPTKVKIVFFHGSGGSVARGGGSIKEQVSWWSASAIESPKMTVQGEMIQRLFATKEILNSQSAHFVSETMRRKTQKSKYVKTKALDHFSNLVAQEYTRLISDTTLLSKLLDATPYKYFSSLRLGSRPSKRPSGTVSLDSLRAIPWTLCWTQTRILWPTWWGVGTAWKSLNEETKENLKIQFKSNPFLSSFVKTMGFTLAKVELSIWRLYLKKDAQLFSSFQNEYDLAVTFIKEISHEKSLIWHRPWLEESIQLRSPHIHILNLLQIIAMEASDENLLRETIVGIACGMLTTG